MMVSSARRWQPRMLAVVLALVVIATGCTSSTSEATRTPAAVATQAPEPTAAPVVLPPPSPTAAPTPTVAPTPVPSPTPVPACGTFAAGPIFDDHCLVGVGEATAFCVVDSTTYFDETGAAPELAISGQQQVVATGVVYRLDEDRRSGRGTLIAQFVHSDASQSDGGQAIGYIATTDIEPGQCLSTAGPAHDFDSLPCQSFPVQQAIGSAASDAVVVADMSILQEPGCARFVFEFRSSTNAPFSVLSTQLAPALTMTSSPTQTGISLPAGFEPGPLDIVPDTTDIGVVFEDENADGVRRLQILHPNSVMRARVLDGPARLVVDLVPADTADRNPEPIVGTTVILKDVVDPTDAGFVVGDTITMRGWLRPRADHVPYIRSFALQDSAAQLEPFYDGVIPFLALGAPLAAPDGAELPSSFTPFAVNVDTQGWFGASHAILIGDDGTERFIGSGAIVQITDIDGGTHALYDPVPSQVLIDSEPTSWVEQG